MRISDRPQVFHRAGLLGSAAGPAGWSSHPEMRVMTIYLGQTSTRLVAHLDRCPAISKRR